jgi:hypothetical protein
MKNIMDQVVEAQILALLKPSDVFDLFPFWVATQKLDLSRLHSGRGPPDVEAVVAQLRADATAMNARLTAAYELNRRQPRGIVAAAEAKENDEDMADPVIAGGANFLLDRVVNARPLNVEPPPEHHLVLKPLPTEFSLRKQFGIEIGQEVREFSDISVTDFLSTYINIDHNEKEVLPTNPNLFEKVFTSQAVRAKFPFVTHLAIRYGMMPATSSAVERLFSKVSLLTHRRGRDNVKLETLFYQLLLSLDKP